MPWCASRTSPRGTRLRPQNSTHKLPMRWVAPPRTTASPRCVTICQSSEPRAWSRNFHTPGAIDSCRKATRSASSFSNSSSASTPRSPPGCYNPSRRTTNFNRSAYLNLTSSTNESSRLSTISSTRLASKPPEHTHNENKREQTSRHNAHNGLRFTFSFQFLPLFAAIHHNSHDTCMTPPCVRLAARLYLKLGRRQ